MRTESSGITFAAQDKLPRLPIPLLEETLQKFPRALEALQDDEEMEDTLRATKEFLEGDGPVLQKALEDYEKKGVEEERIGSYVEEFWNESYLSPDASVVLNLNPFFVLEKDPDPKVAKDQVRRAASLCFASVKLASLLRHETLEPDVFRGKPLCMDQFRVLFGSSRQPTKNGQMDDIHVYNDSGHGTTAITARPCLTNFRASAAQISLTPRFAFFGSRCSLPKPVLLLHGAVA
jgi:carnitine O-acetyltransferase